MNCVPMSTQANFNCLCFSTEPFDYRWLALEICRSTPALGLNCKATGSVHRSVQKLVCNRWNCFVLDRCCLWPLTEIINGNDKIAVSLKLQWIKKRNPHLLYNIWRHCYAMPLPTGFLFQVAFFLLFFGGVVVNWIPKEALWNFWISIIINCMGSQNFWVCVWFKVFMNIFNCYQLSMFRHNFNTITHIGQSLAILN